MDSEFENRSQNSSSSELLRYRSAPSSYFLENFSDGVVKNGIKGTENNGLGSKFNLGATNGRLVSHNSLTLEEGKAMFNGFGGLNSQLPPQYPKQNSSTQVGSMDNGYKFVGSLGLMDQQGQNKLGSNLMRQNSSPAGLFSHLNAQKGYATLPSSSRLKGQLSFPSGTSSLMGMLTQISEVDNESSITTDDKFGNGNSEAAHFYNSGLPFASWTDTSHLQDTFNVQKRELLDIDENLFANSQIGQLGNRPPMLSHHLSLPKTPAELAALDKLLQSQDTIPCKIRAKRGCATHPRSIAERVRRTRISERMRKLQELVPNMDKQTNTADMLDLAVEYIKDLQNEYKTLTDYKANCKCSATKNSVSSRRV